MRCGAKLGPLGLVLALPLVAIACGRSGSSGRSSGLVVQRDTVGDTIVVRTVSGSEWGAARTLVPEVAIGEESGDSTYLFGRITALAVGPKGTIYVLDRQAMVIRAYGPDGKYLRTLGRRGAGPGELAQPLGMLVLSDGRVLVFDPGNSRVQVYAPDGTPAAQWPVRQSGYFGVSRFWRDTLDDVYVPYYVRTPSKDPTTAWKAELVRFAPDGTPEDTLAFPETDFKAVTVRAEQTQNGRVMGIANYIVPFMPMEMWAFEPAGYLVYALSDAYRIDLLRTHAPILRIERTRAPVPVTEREWDSHKAGITESIHRFVSDWKWNGPGIPAHKPPFKGFFVGRHGRLWVWVSMPAQERDNPNYDPKTPGSRRTSWVEPLAFDVFEPDGTYLGRVRGPGDFVAAYPSPVFDGDHVWAVTRDSLGVERVVRYRVAADTTAVAGS